MKKHKKKIIVVVAIFIVLVFCILMVLNIQRRNKELIAVATEVVTLDTTAYYIPVNMRNADANEIEAFKQDIYERLAECAQLDTFSFTQIYNTSCELIDEQYETGIFFEDLSCSVLDVGDITKTERYMSVQLYVETIERTEKNQDSVYYTYYDVKLAKENESWKMVSVEFVPVMT